MDVKKREESEKISFKELQPLEMGENDVFGRKKMFWPYELFEINTRRTDRRTNRRMDKPIDILMSGPMDGPRDGPTDRPTNQRTS